MITPNPEWPRKPPDRTFRGRFIVPTLHIITFYRSPIQSCSTGELFEPLPDLPLGSPEEVKREVRRVKSVLGPHLIVSPSHEAILPDVPPRNVAALAEAALES